MDKRITYTIFIQFLGIITAIFKNKTWPKRLVYYGDKQSFVWIHTHNATAEYIMKKFNKESWGESYVRGSWFQDPNRLKKSKALMYCTDDQSKNFSLICYQTPGKARPYYAMSGSKEALVLFISRQVDIPWVELSLR